MDLKDRGYGGLKWNEMYLTWSSGTLCGGGPWWIIRSWRTQLGTLMLFWYAHELLHRASVPNKCLLIISCRYQQVAVRREAACPNTRSANLKAWSSSPTTLQWDKNALENRNTNQQVCTNFQKNKGANSEFYCHRASFLHHLKKFCCLAKLAPGICASLLIRNY